MPDAIYLSTALCIAVAGIVTHSFAPRFGDRISTNRWLASCMLLAAGIVVFKSSVPKLVTVAGFAAITAGLALQINVMRRALRWRPRSDLLAILVVVVVVTNLWLQGDPSTARRINALVLLALMLLGAWHVWQIGNLPFYGPVPRVLPALNIIAGLLILPVVWGLGQGGGDGWLGWFTNQFAGVVATVVMTLGSMAFLFHQLTQHSHAMRELATLDVLTGVANRRALDEQLESLRRHHKRASPLCLAMLDIDHFKRVNDEYGHLAGDEALRQLGHQIRGMIRPTDFIGRYGGEEFCLLLPNTPSGIGVRVVERLRTHFADLEIRTDSGALRCTLSAGMVAWQSADEAPASVIARADAALYAAKKNGRNRTVVG